MGYVETCCVAQLCVHEIYNTEYIVVDFCMQAYEDEYRNIYFPARPHVVACK